MRVAHSDEGEQIKIDIRGNGRDGRVLLAGDDNSPDNYRLNLSRQTGEVYSPRHKHNFDQLRMVLGGGVANYGPKRFINPGEIVYFPEGTPYGPQEGDSQRFGMTLQFGGASGCGFISRRRMSEGMEALKTFGTFEKGIFHRTDDPPAGTRRKQDAYEAVWEYVEGRKMRYPEPRYDDPIHMRPDNFAWRDLPGQPGAFIKQFGRFSERRIEVSMLRIAQGAQATIAPRGGRQLGLVVEGAGRLDGNELRQHSAFELLRDEGANLAGSSAIELLLIGLPIFTLDEIRQIQDDRKARLAVQSAA